MSEESLHEYCGATEAEEQSQDALLRDMKRELSVLTAEFDVPGSKLRNLLEVSHVVCATRTREKNGSNHFLIL